ncbi:MAG: secretin N-terminal domain-containing protein [Planctomycetota bacterium]
MKRSLIIVLAVIASTTVVLIMVRDYIPAGKVPERSVESKADTEADRPSKDEKPGKAKWAKEEGEPYKRGKVKESGEPDKPGEPNEAMENLNLKNVEMKDIIAKLAEWTGRVIIPHEEAMKQKITVYAPEKLPRSQALSLIYSALREKGTVAELKDNAIILRPIKGAKLRAVPTVPANVPLASITNKEQIVEKFFKLRNCSPSRLQKVVQPLLPEHGYVYAVESTNHIVVIDTVLNLQRIQRIIQQLDVQETQETVIKTFEIKEGDPVEIVQLLNILLGDGQGGNPKRGGSPGNDRKKGRPKEGEKKDGGKPAQAVVIGASESPMRLIALSERRWIIAKASAQDMVQIQEWITNLDQKKPEEREYSLRQIRFADVVELAEHINNMVRQMPLRANVTVQPLVRARQLMIIGSEENRKMVEELVTDVDIETQKFFTEHIKLEFADPEVIKENIDELYTEYSYWEYRSRYGSSRGRRYQRGGAGDPDLVRVVAYPTLKQVTVIASADNIEKVKKQIKEWDRPIDVNDVAPCVIQLENSDPVKMADLLTNLFTETRRERSWLDIYLGRGGVSRTIVGPLYGQMAFEAVEDTRKLIVVSKIPEGYDVARKLVAELDREEKAEVPLVKELKYADAEDLCERLNAIFNLAGTPAPIRRTARGLSEYSMDDTQEGEPGGRNQPADTRGPGEYMPPWSRGRPLPGEMPISRVIGRIRFIPDPRSKAVMVLTPAEYVEEVEEMIEVLDKPGMQVRIKAAILQVDHRNLTSLGLQLASDPRAFGTLEENAIAALTELTLLEEHGSLTIRAALNVTALIDFLVKRIDAKVLNQQTLWTKDNEEADFFRGQKVAFTESITFSQEGGRDVQSFEYPRVGMSLRVRPSITPEKDVDMTLNLIISQRTSELINGQPVRNEVDAETTLIVEDGETIMLGGTLFQEDSTLERKIPLFGDLPVLGGLFRHNEIVKANTEILVFVTPYVIDENPANMLPETIQNIESERERLKRILEELKTTVENNV